MNTVITIFFRFQGLLALLSGLLWLYLIREQNSAVQISIPHEPVRTTIPALLFAISVIFLLPFLSRLFLQRMQRDFAHKIVLVILVIAMIMISFVALATGAGYIDESYRQLEPALLGFARGSSVAIAILLLFTKAEAEPAPQKAKPVKKKKGKDPSKPVKLKIINEIVIGNEDNDRSFRELRKSRSQF